MMDNVYTKVNRMSGDSVKVAVRVRPFNQREKNANSKCVVSMSGNSTTIKHPESGKTHTFAFDFSYWSHDGYTQDDNGVYIATGIKYADQRTVFSDLGQGVLKNAWEGYNAALFAYGQTGSGKSYSMTGYGPNKGIVPITCDELFKAIDENEDDKKQLQVTYSMLEIYNEQVRDLLSTPVQGHRGHLKVRQHPQSGFFVEGLKSVPVRSYKEIERLMDEGTVNRTTASTNMNATSSRSHMVITIKFKQVFINEYGESTTKSSEMNLVDLAGSERADSTGATGDRLKEGSAINQSLSTLGNVISALADQATGKKKVLVPYRDSVLTKLLQGALGGNSKTIMIAALSPADINYDETLSTLRYADRAKKIQNKAVINESPTDRLIRELKEENAKLQAMLKQSGSANRGGADLEMLLKENERKMLEVETTWEQRLEQARKEWELSSIHKSETDLSEQYPYLQNINEDPQLSGIIKYPLQSGETVIGRAGNSPDGNKIELKGLGIQSWHVSIYSNKEEVTLKPMDCAKTIVNGRVVTSSRQLQHLDRIKFGSNSIFLYVGFPHERQSKEDIQKYDYDSFQSELAEAEGFSNQEFFHKENDDTGPDPAALRIYQDYIKLLPMIAEVNAMSEEMEKGVVFEAFIKNLASHDVKGRDKAKEIEVKVTGINTNQIWIWSKPKFINRKFIIEELYQKAIDDEINITTIGKTHDPFWDPIEDIFVGSAHVWLQSLAYLMGLDDQIEVQNYSGREEAILQCSLQPCNTKGILLGDESMVLDPNELVNKRLDFMVTISHCLGVKWIKEENRRGVMCKFEFYDCPQEFKTKTVWNTINPKLGFKKQFTINPVTVEFLNYLQTHALVIELWGTQAAVCDDYERKVSTISLPDEMQRGRTGSWMSQENSWSSELEHQLAVKERDIAELQEQLMKKRDENVALAQAYSATKKEVFSLKEKLEKSNDASVTKAALRTSKLPSSSKGHRPAVVTSNDHPASPSVRSRSPSPQRIKSAQGNPTCPASASLDAEIAKALKFFFKDIKQIQQLITNLKQQNEKVMVL
ncbi:kinesin-like protein KIF28P isoform X2 [Ptychodera flava]|uniref:kinesin-like protein KIF28P isoform X2 n=1 Tax=Ptychodera flava TaxID=63121 RepID=UPI00396A2D02